MWWLILCAYATMSLMTFIAFWFDKRASMRANARRIPENTLHLLELLGGFPGAMAGQRLLRHKSWKLQYRVIVWIIAALHVAAWAAVLWYHWKAN